MVLVQQAWFVIRQVDNVHARQMYPDYNVEFVKMDSKIIQIAQVINGDSKLLHKKPLKYFLCV